MRTKRRRTTKRRRSRKQVSKTRAKRFLPRRLRGGSEGSEEHQARVLKLVQAAGLKAFATPWTPVAARDSDIAVSELAAISLTQSDNDEAARYMEQSKAAKQIKGDQEMAQALSMAPGSFRGGPSQMNRVGQVKARVNQDYQKPSYERAMPCKVDDVVTILEEDGEWSKVRNQSREEGWVPSSFLEIKGAGPEPDPDEIAAKVCEAYYKREINDYILSEEDVALINTLWEARQERDAQGITMDELNEYLWNSQMRVPIPGSDRYTPGQRKDAGSVMSDEEIRRGLFNRELPSPELLEDERRKQDHADTSPLFIYSERMLLLKRQELEKKIAQRIKDAVSRGRDAIEFTMTLKGPYGKPFYRGPKEALS